LACPIAFDGSAQPSCESSTPPGNALGDSFGLSLNVAPDQTITVSLNQHPLHCDVTIKVF